MTIERRDYVALEWVAGEISETLVQCATALDAYLADRADTTRLRFCLTYVHQVYGTLKMVEFAGAALLAEEMEAVVEALLSHKISEAQQEDALQALRAALAELPGYLQQLLAQHRDAPALLLPIINDLRAVRGEMLITESAMFVPAQPSAAFAAQPAVPMAAAELLDVARKLRQMYQMALLNYLRNKEPRENLNYLAKVCARLAKLAAGKASEPTWKICIALCEGLLNRSIQPTAAVKALLRQVDGQLKQLAEQGAPALDLEPASGLIKNLLYYIAASGANSRYIAEIKHAYNLDQALPAAAEFADADVALSIKAALAQQLLALAEALASEQMPAQLLAAVKRAQDTAALLGMNNAQSGLRDLARELQSGAVNTDRAVPMLRQLADGLELAGQGAAPRALFNDSEEAQEQLDKAFDAVMRESRNSLEQAKEAIIEFVATQWRHQSLEDVPALLAAVRGSFAVAGLHRAADVLAACETFVRSELLEQRKIPAWQLLDTLADAIASVDYYLERLAEDADAECESILAVAEQSVAALALAPQSDLISASQMLNSAQVIPFQRAQPSNRAAENLIDDNTPLDDTTEGDDRLADGAADLTAEEAVAFAEVGTSRSAPAQFDVAAVDEGEDDTADAEIIDIFIEEAGEVLDTIAEYLPAWSESPHDSETLSVIRRAFHTLKGSGRMVGAIDIGELAWSIENMLNRIVDGTLLVDGTRRELVRSAAAAVPAMVEAFRTRQPCDHSTARALSDHAFALAREQSPALAPIPGAPLLFESGSELEPEPRPDTLGFEAPPVVASTPELLGDRDSIERYPEPPLLVDDDSDSMLLDIFAAEALTHLQTVEDFIERSANLAGPAELSDDLQRALHTLKGSAHMADVQPVASIVTPVEHLIKELRSAQLKADPDVIAVLTEGAQLIRAALTQLSNGLRNPIPGTEQFVGWVDALYHTKLGQSEEDLTAPESGISPAALSHFLSDSVELISAVSDDLRLWQQARLDDERQHTLAATINQVVDSAELLNLAPVEELGQALQTLLRQGADAVVDDSFFALAEQAAETLIDMLDRIAANQQPDSPSELVATLQEFEFAGTGFDLGEFEIPTLEDIVPSQTAPLDPVEDSTVVAFDLSESEDIVADLDDLAAADELSRLGQLADSGDEQIPLADAENLLAPEFDADSITAEELTEFAGPADALEIEIDGFDAAAAPLETAPAQSDSDQEDTDTPIEAAAPDSAGPEYLQAESTGEEDSGREAIDSGMDTDSAEWPAEIELELPKPEPTSDELAPIEHNDEPQPPLVTMDDVFADEGDDEEQAYSSGDAEIDAEILEIFIEEAGDLLEAIDEAVHGWSEAPGNALFLDDLQRLLHTLKGGARLAGLRNLGNLSHNFETLLINAQQQGRDADAALFAQVHNYQDQLVRLVDAVKRDGHSADRQLLMPQPPAEENTSIDGEFIAAPPAADTPNTEALSSMLAELLPRDDKQPHSDASETLPQSSRVVPFARPAPEPTPFEAPTPRQQSHGHGQSPQPIQQRNGRDLQPRETEDLPEQSGVGGQLRRGPQEVIKMSAQLLEQLVNLAGETSIARARSEEQVNEFVFSLDEMQITVDRLQEQVRRLDLETEAQMLFRQEQVESEGLEGFDPLEFDRYSLLQQLSRSLLESASDLIDIKNTLADKSRDMETLLVQQSRINSELQEGLMRSRMVPFARMVPRLRRIVRQVAGELDKRVDFYVDNAEGELDRTVLERVVAPLEHMLRNAIDHGIEPVDTRIAEGKPGQGTIVLSLNREGGEIVLTLSDDGRGIDLEAVRTKAIDRGLMVAGANLTDHEIMQFILQSGFSTAKQVTQISGRGVGMDVVYSEIKQLGGSLEIDSAWGQGTRFTVRLPFTVSVNRALMVNVAGDIYAIPLNSIEGIVRVSPFELEAYYQPDAPLFEYAGQPYLMRYMGALTRTGDKPNLEGLTMPLPVLLVRGSEHAVAVQVDGLLGSREIVVKTLGPQFGLVQGLSGATVLGDGSVVVILDLMAMIRADASQLHRDILLGQEELMPERSRPLLVMVVDDSVTVRKVTSRFLERQGMEVMLAKDGVDAINLLQESEQVPDVMLLDIEMPRMDGFEVASRIRHTSRLQHIPIIMITSRTGEKHRERAFSLGVNRYLGKPYQELALLDTIHELTGTTSSA